MTGEKMQPPDEIPTLVDPPPLPPPNRTRYRRYEDPYEDPYNDRRRRDEGFERAPEGNKFAPIVIALVIALVVSWGMINFIGTPKNTYQADITRLETDLVAMREANTKFQAGATATVNSAKTSAKALSADLTAKFNDLKNVLASDYIRKSSAADTSALAKRISALESADPALAKRATALEAQVAALEAQVTALEKKTAASPTSDSDTSTLEGVSIRVDTIGGMPLIFDGISTAEVSNSIRVKITNNSGRNIENIQATLIFYTNTKLPTFVEDWPKLESVNPNWYLLNSDDYTLIFITGWNLAGINFDLDVGESKTIYPRLLLKATDTSQANTDYYFSVEGEVVDFEYVS